MIWKYTENWMEMSRIPRTNHETMVEKKKPMDTSRDGSWPQ